jgi:single-strand DNA-binding protein
MLNVVNIQGRICNEIVIRYTQSQTAVTSFRIAVDNDSSGDKKKTYFFNVTCWGKTAEFVDKYFSKGDMILLNGSLQTKEWTDKEGRNRSDVEINVIHAYFFGKKMPLKESDAVNVSAGDWEDYTTDDDSDLPF